MGTKKNLFEDAVAQFCGDEKPLLKARGQQFRMLCKTRDEKLTGDFIRYFTGKKKDIKKKNLKIIEDALEGKGSLPFPFYLAVLWEIGEDSDESAKKLFKAIAIYFSKLLEDLHTLARTYKQPNAGVRHKIQRIKPVGFINVAKTLANRVGKDIKEGENEREKLLKFDPTLKKNLVENIVNVYCGDDNPLHKALGEKGRMLCKTAEEEITGDFLRYFLGNEGDASSFNEKMKEDAAGTEVSHKISDENRQFIKNVLQGKEYAPFPYYLAVLWNLPENADNENVQKLFDCIERSLAVMALNLSKLAVVYKIKEEPFGYLQTVKLNEFGQAAKMAGNLAAKL